MTELAFYELDPDGDCNLLVYGTTNDARTWATMFEEDLHQSKAVLPRLEPKLEPDHDSDADTSPPRIVRQTKKGQKGKNGRRTGAELFTAPPPDPIAYDGEPEDLDIARAVENSMNDTQSNLASNVETMAGPSTSTVAPDSIKNDGLSNGNYDATGDFAEPEEHIKLDENPTVGNSTIESDHHRFRVSSKHLMYTCDHYKKVLTAGMSEHEQMRTEGIVSLQLEDQHPIAVLHILNIIHTQFDDVPATIDLDLLTHVAVLVDYIRCHKTVKYFTNMWIKALRHTVPNEYSPGLLQWMLIAAIFQHEDIFKTTTSIAVRQACGPVVTLDLPIRPNILDCLTVQRELALTGMFSDLSKILDRLEEDTEHCSPTCDAILLGLLRRECRKRNFIPSAPSSPYIGYSVNSLANSIRCFQKPRWYAPDEFSGSYYNSYDPGSCLHSCDLTSHTTPIIHTAEKIATGLDL